MYSKVISPEFSEEFVISSCACVYNSSLVCVSPQLLSLSALSSCDSDPALREGGSSPHTHFTRSLVHISHCAPPGTHNKPPHTLHLLSKISKSISRLLLSLLPSLFSFLLQERLSFSPLNPGTLIFDTLLKNKLLHILHTCRTM